MSWMYKVTSTNYIPMLYIITNYYQLLYIFMLCMIIGSCQVKIRYNIIIYYYLKILCKYKICYLFLWIKYNYNIIELKPLRRLPVSSSKSTTHVLLSISKPTRRSVMKSLSFHPSVSETRLLVSPLT